MKVFILDPQVETRQKLYDYFAAQGCQVTALTKPEEILNLLKSNLPQLIVLGLGSDVETHLALLRSLPRHEARIPTVVLAPLITPDLEKQVMECGASEIYSYQLPLPELYSKATRILSQQSKKISSPSSPPAEKLLLIVDDDPAIRKLLKTFFEMKGFGTVLAESGEEALLKLKESKPSMVLLDVTMPGMDGLMTLKKIKESNPEIGVVMATGLQDEAIAQKATALGSYAYVMKPFDMKYLELVVTTRLLMSF